MKKKGFLKTGELDQDFELNITSIIDCFVVLIAFVLVSTSFFSIGIVDAEVAGASSSAEATPDSTPVVIELKSDRSIVLKSGPSGRRAVRISASDLANRLEALKKRDPEIKSAIVVADDSVEYRDVMASMEVAKGQLAQVNLGGF
jgi:biopolymer transport protein ExbD